MSGRRRGGGGGGGGGGDAGGGTGVARNKRGTPMYSREDIREQYCINDKELHALEASRRKPIFGCLTSGNTQQPSPCKKKSLLPACLRGRVPSDENVYIKSQSAHTSPAHRKPQPDQIDYEDETYFKRRPKSICYTDPRRLATLDDSLPRSGRSPRPRSEAGNTTYDTYLSDEAQSDAARRPTQLAITSGGYHSTEIFPEDAIKEGYTLRRTAYTQPNTPDLGHSTRFREVATPEVFLDDRPQKHVSFQKAMSRSATVGGLEEHGGLTQDDSGRGSAKSGGSRSQERLLDGRRSPDYMEQRALDQLLAPVLTRALLQEPGDKKQRKHPGEALKRSGGQEVDYEAGSRSRSRTPSIRRKKTEKITIGVQTDDPVGLGAPRKGPEPRDGVWGEGSGPGRAKAPADTVAKRQQKPRTRVVVVEAGDQVKPTRKETVHFSDQLNETIHVTHRPRNPDKPVKRTKDKAVGSTVTPDVARAAAPPSRSPVVEKKTSSRGRLEPTKDVNVRGNPAASEGIAKSASQVSKVSMGMQTESLTPSVLRNPIFLTEDLDTSVDWQGEESSVDLHTSASCSAWQTDESSFNWQTDASSYTRHMDAYPLPGKDDLSSLGLGSGQNTDAEDVLNIDIDSIGGRRHRQVPEVLVRENVAWDGGGTTPIYGLGQRDEMRSRVVENTRNTDEAKIRERCKGRYEKGDRNDSRIVERREKEEEVSREESQNYDDQDPDIMLRRLRFRRQMAEDFLQQVAPAGKGAVQSSSKGPSPVPGERGREEPPTSTDANISSTFPRKNAKDAKPNNKTSAIPQEYFEDWKGKVPLETSRTWPKRSIDAERSDDIDLRAFDMMCDTRVADRRKTGKPNPPYKTSHLEINLVYDEQKCLKISSSQTTLHSESNARKATTTTPQSPTKMARQENPAFQKDRKDKAEMATLTIEKRAKHSRVEEISDDYPRSENDYKPSTSVSPSSKKSSTRPDGTKSMQRKKKTSQRDLSEASTAAHKATKPQEIMAEHKKARPKDQLPEPTGMGRNFVCYTTDTSSTVTNTDSVGRRVRRVRKKTLAIQTDCDGMVIPEQREDTQEGGGKARIDVKEALVKLKEVPIQTAEPVRENDSTRENESSNSVVTSLRRKKSVRRKSRCIQTSLSPDDNDTLTPPVTPNPIVESARPPGVHRDGGTSPSRLQVPNSRTGRSERNLSDQESKQDTASINTNTSSLRRMRKVRKTTATTQTDDSPDHFPCGAFPPDAQPDSISVRTSSLRRIRKTEKRTMGIQTDEAIPVTLENLHLTLTDLTGHRDVRALLGRPSQTDSLIYVNIPAAFLELGESGNDADVSGVESDDQEGLPRGGAARTYSKVAEESEDEEPCASAVCGTKLLEAAGCGTFLAQSRMNISLLNVTYDVGVETHVGGPDGESDHGEDARLDGESDLDDVTGAPDGESDHDDTTGIPDGESDYEDDTGAPDGESDHDAGALVGVSDDETDVGAPDGESDHETYTISASNRESDHDIEDDSDTDDRDGNSDENEGDHLEMMGLKCSEAPARLRDAGSDEDDSEENTGNIYVVEYQQTTEAESEAELGHLEETDDEFLNLYYVRHLSDVNTDNDGRYEVEDREKRNTGYEREEEQDVNVSEREDEDNTREHEEHDNVDTPMHDNKRHSNVADQERKIKMFEEYLLKKVADDTDPGTEDERSLGAEDEPSRDGECSHEGKNLQNADANTRENGEEISQEIQEECGVTERCATTGNDGGKDHEFGEDVRDDMENVEIGSAVPSATLKEDAAQTERINALEAGVVPPAVEERRPLLEASNPDAYATKENRSSERHEGWGTKGSDRAAGNGTRPNFPLRTGDPRVVPDTSPDLSARTGNRKRASRPEREKRTVFEKEKSREKRPLHEKGFFVERASHSNMEMCDKDANENAQQVPTQASERESLVSGQVSGPGKRVTVTEDQLAVKDRVADGTGNERELKEEQQTWQNRSVTEGHEENGTRALQAPLSSLHDATQMQVGEDTVEIPHPPHSNELEEPHSPHASELEEGPHTSALEKEPSPPHTSKLEEPRPPHKTELEEPHPPHTSELEGGSGTSELEKEPHSPNTSELREEPHPPHKNELVEEAAPQPPHTSELQEPHPPHKNGREDSAENQTLQRESIFMESNEENGRLRSSETLPHHPDEADGSRRAFQIPRINVYEEESADSMEDARSLESGHTFSEDEDDVLVITYRPFQRKGSSREGSESTQRDTDSMQRDIDSMQRDTDSMQRDTDSMQRDINSMQRDTESMQRDTDSMQRDTDSMQRDTDSMQRDTDSMQRDTDSMQRDIDSMQRDTDSMQRDTDSMQRDTDSMQRDTNSMQRDTDSMQRDTDSMQRDTDSMQRDTESMQKDTESMHKEIASMHRDTKSMHRDTESIQRDKASVHRDTEAIHSHPDRDPGERLMYKEAERRDDKRGKWKRSRWPSNRKAGDDKNVDRSEVEGKTPEAADDGLALPREEGKKKKRRPRRRKVKHKKEWLEERGRAALAGSPGQEGDPHGQGRLTAGLVSGNENAREVREAEGARDKGKARVIKSASSVVGTKERTGEEEGTGQGDAGKDMYKGSTYRPWAEEVEDSHEWVTHHSDAERLSPAGMDPSRTSLDDTGETGDRAEGTEGAQRNVTADVEMSTEEDDTSYHEEDSSRCEEESEGVEEGGGEQNAYVEYMMIRAGGCQEEMRAVDLIFKEVFKEYDDSEFLTDDDVSESEFGHHLPYMTGRDEGLAHTALQEAAGATSPVAYCHPEPQGRGRRLPQVGTEPRPQRAKANAKSKDEEDSFQDAQQAGETEEKLKRSCMRTQATQTDAGVVRKSMPHLSFSPASEKAEMVSQGAQTNGDSGRRKLVKSLSEVARYEGLQYEIYDLDDFTELSLPARAMSQEPPPSPPRFSAFDIPLDEGPPPPPLKFRQNYHEIFIDSSPRKPRRGLLQKTLSEGEILSERRRALSLASGYIEVDINGYRDTEEEVIKPQCVNEISRDLSRSKIFTPDSFIEEEEEFHENMLHKEILPAIFPYERKLSQISTDSDLKTFDPNEFRSSEHLQSQLTALSLDSLIESGPCLLDAGSLIEGITARDGSPMLYVGTPSEATGVGEFGDHMEESVSESQVTVVQRAFTASSQVITSDSENGSFHLTDHSSAATTPSTRHKSLHTTGSFEEDLEDELLPRLRVSNLVHSATTLSSIEDEPTSVSENVISDSSQGPATASPTSSEFDKAIAGSTDNDYSSIRSGESMTIKSDVLEEEEFENDIIIEENIMARLVQEMKDGESLSHIPIKTSDFRDDARRLASPESDSSSSLFTEQETSRSPVSGTTNTMTSKSDLSRTDSHPTDYSETSEDYITATENSTNDLDARRSYSLEERHVSSPPGMADIYEDEVLTPKIVSPEAGFQEQHELSDITEGYSVASDFETAQDLTSPDGDTTTSASYYIEHSIGEDSDKVVDTKTKPEVPPKPTFLPKPEVPPKPERLSPSRETSPKSPESHEFIEYEEDVSPTKREKCAEESKTGAIKKRYSAGGKVIKDDNKRYSRYFEDNEKGELAEVRGQSQQQSWSEEDREKAKQTLKLDFPPGVTMFGEAPNWPDADNLKTGDVEKKLRVFDKPKKSVKIDLASVEDLQALHSKTESPSDKDKETPVSDNRQTKAKTDKSKRKSEEVITPGMVRSPAMHEGFRLEDWTPVRTPVTPDRAVDLDTSDESYTEAPRHPPKGRSPGRRSKDSPGKKGESPSGPAESPLKQVGERQSPVKMSKLRESPQRTEIMRESPERQSRQSPRRSGVQQSSPVRDSAVSKTERPSTHPLEVQQRQSPVRFQKAGGEPLKRLSEIPVGSAREAPDVFKRHSADVTLAAKESQDLLKPSGPVTGYLRSGSQSPTSRERPLQLPESKLLAIAPMKDSRRSAESLRSMSPGSDNVFLSGSREQLDEDARPALCAQCGERPASREGLLRPSPPAGTEVTVERRLSDREPSRPRTVGHRAKSEERNSFSKDWGMTPISLELGDSPRHDSDDDEKGVYLDPYRASPWVYVAPSDEAKVWRRDEGSPSPMPDNLRIPGFDDHPEPEAVLRSTPDPAQDAAQDTAQEPAQDTAQDQQDKKAEVEEEKQSQKDKGRRQSVESTCSEKEFRRRYQAITHRMVHRKASVEMYRRLVQATFQSDKTVTVSRDSGEFGFRIHGSRPVVVSAIEPDTPAETSGLEVGDIIININGANVLDASHSEVVRLAHAGCDTLRLEVARTCDVLTPLVTHDPTPLCAGYLYKLGGAHHTLGSSTIIRKWHRRWFALKKDNCLYYYKSEMEQHPLGAVHLLDYSVHALAEVGKPFSFTVAKFGGMTLHLAAHTEEARNRWGQVITQAAAQAAQRDELMDISSRRIQQAPASIASPDCFGFLYKLGARWHQWKRRYCVLKDACLYLYHDTDATQAIGVVHLHGYRVQSTSIGGKKHAFELLPPEPKFRHFYFYSESDSDKKRWLAALEYSIDRWIKVG